MEVNQQQLENDIEDARSVINIAKTPNEREALRRRQLERMYAIAEAISRDLLQHGEGTSAQGTGLARIKSDLSALHNKFMPLNAPPQSKSTF